MAPLRRAARLGLALALSAPSLALAALSTPVALTPSLGSTSAGAAGTVASAAIAPPSLSLSASPRLALPLSAPGSSLPAAAAPLAPAAAAAAAKAPTRPMPFPDLAGMMAEGLGIKRPARPPLQPLPPIADPSSLPKDVLGTVLMRMAARQNWGDVAYAASNITTIEGKIRAQWMSDDSRAEVREYFAQLSEEQQRIAEAAFAGGMAETPPSRDWPELITLDWVKTHFPPRASRR